MKPANAPAAKNARRIRAAERRQAQLTSGLKANHGKDYPLTAEDRSRIDRELNALTLRIVAPAVAASIRTKKTEALGWSEARRSWRRGRITR